MDKVLHQETVDSARDFKKAESALIEKLIETDKCKNFAYYGSPSLFRYCTDLLGLSESETYRFIQVTRKSVEVPALKEAVSKGVLTVSKASRIASVITPLNQVEWIEKASTLKQKDLEREVAKENPKSIVTKESLKVITEDLSSLNAILTKEEELLLRRAREVLRTNTLKEAVFYALAFTLKHKDPMEKVKRKRHEPSLRKVKPQALRQKQSYIPVSIIHQVNERDKRQCQEKGCGSRSFTEIHHIIHRSKGGKDTLDNLTTLCSMHHNMRHNFQKHLWKNLPPKINLNKISPKDRLT